jgi:hypothetical protein
MSARVAIEYQFAAIDDCGPSRGAKTMLDIVGCENHGMSRADCLVQQIVEHLNSVSVKAGVGLVQENQ